MLIYKKIIIAACLLLPVNLPAQNTEKEDTLQGRFLETIVINSYNTHTDFYGRRYDGQARTEHLLDNIPGINLISRGNFAQEPVLRGMSDGQINITINGMRMFGACTDRMDPVTSYIEPNNMKSLQVCSGPCFGSCSATIGGGMNFDLRQAQANATKRWSGSVGTGFETNGAARQFLGNIQYSGKRFAFSLDGIYRKADDYTPGGNKNENIKKYGEWMMENGFTVDDKGRINFSQYGKWNTHANALYHLDAHHSLSADYLQDEANHVGYPALSMDVNYAKSKVGSITHEYRNTDKALYYWQTKIYYNDVNHAMDNNDRPMEQIPMQMMRMNMKGHSQTGGAFTQLYWKASSSHLIKTKLETYNNKWHADMMMKMAMDPMDNPMAMPMLTMPDIKRTVAGLDVTDEIRLNNAWHINPGIHTEYSNSSVFSSEGKMRLDSIYSGNPDRTNWLYNVFVGLDYHPASAFGIDLKLARAMRSPTLKEMYACYLYNRVDGYDYIGNPAIKKESSFNTEINFSYRQKNFKATIKGFGYFFQNYIAGFVQMDYMPMTADANGVKQFGNVHSAYITGASLLLNWHLSPKVLFNSNTTLQQGKDNNNNYLPMMMPLKSVNTIRYAANNWRFFIEGTGATVQNRTSAFYGETNTPGFFIADAGADKTIGLNGGRQIILSVTYNNIFNTYYYENLDVIKLPRQGRNFIIHATYNF